MVQERTNTNFVRNKENCQSSNIYRTNLYNWHITFSNHSNLVDCKHLHVRDYFEHHFLNLYIQVLFSLKAFCGNFYLLIYGNYSIFNLYTFRLRNIYIYELIYRCKNKKCEFTAIVRVPVTDEQPVSKASTFQLSAK